MKKRLIDKKSDQESFKNWIKQHDFKTKWDWDNPSNLRKQFVRVIKESGDIDLSTIFHLMFIYSDTGLSIEQNSKFLGSKY